jgi:transposase
VARFKEYSYEQSRFIPVSLSEQIQPGTIEYTINYLVDNEIDLSVFHTRFHNDENGAPAFDPVVLLKIVLFAYSRGIISSRKIAQCCEENVVFMALSADSRPHFTTIAEFVSTMDEQIVSVFTDVLTVCYSEGLIGRTMFAIDGCKIAANCAKEWSGTRKELLKKAQKIEESIRVIVKKHRDGDHGEGGTGGIGGSEQQRLETLQAKAKKIRRWLSQNEDRIGERGKPIKSNITDNESAKMPSAHGVIQGYNGLAAVDEKHQIIVHAQAFGEGTEAKNLTHMIEGIRGTFTELEGGGDVYEQVVLTADSGFHSEESVKGLLDDGIDAYVADRKFRSRDANFANAQEYKKKTVDRKRTSKGRKYFSADEFRYDQQTGALICPAGKEMKRRAPNARNYQKGYRGIAYIGSRENCLPCPLREQCIRKPVVTAARQVTKYENGIRHEKLSYTQRMIERFDSVRGQVFYRKRMGTVEPVFANIRSTLGLDRFTLRGLRKVNVQWHLFCLVHNIGKLSRYAMCTA